MTQNELIRWFSVAVASMEGFFITPEQWRAMGRKLPKDWKPGEPITVAQRNHNPGNLRSWGKRPIVAGYAYFETAEEGWTALKKQIKLNVYGAGTADVYSLRSSGLTFREFFAGQLKPDGTLKKGGYPGYAPAVDANKPAQYAEYVKNYIVSRAELRNPPEVLAALSIDSRIKELEILT